MEMITALCLLVSTSLLLYFGLLDQVRDRIKCFRGKFPPGPLGLPFFGSFLSIGDKPYLKFGSWVRHYGNIFFIRVFHLRVFVISDATLAKEAWNNPALLGKPESDLLKVFGGGDYGVLATQGHDWVVQRRFMLRQLRDYGFGKSAMETLVLQEVEEMMATFKLEEGQPIPIKRKFAVVVINSLWQIMSGQRISQTDYKLKKLLDLNNQSLNDVTNNPLGIFFPRIAEHFPKYTGWNNLLKAIAGLRCFLIQTIEEHRQALPSDLNQEPRDFIEAYLQEIRKTTDPKSSFYKDVGEQSLIATLGDLFTAGSDTTTSTLSWAILYISSCPEVQQTIHEEIDRVVGNSRRITLEDRKSLPYIEAVILETLRKSSIVSLGLFHVCTADTSLGPYEIPKGSWICVNQHFIHHNPEVWDRPHEFLPQRFLSRSNSEDSKSSSPGKIKSGDLMAFSAGKRICVGQNLAMDSLFLFLSNIYHQFSIEFDPSSPKPTFDSLTNYFLSTVDYKVVLTSRTFGNGNYCK